MRIKLIHMGFMQHISCKLWLPPVPHLLHVVFPVWSWYFPSSHGEHVSFPAVSLTYPAGHGEHVFPTCVYPFMHTQSFIVFDPVPIVVDPDGRVLHFSFPVSFWYSPISHTLHWD